MTERLYYTDAYLQAFEAAVTDVSADGTRVYLDRTAFYPTSGGQPHDIGQIAGIQVVDVVDEGERIAHLLAAPLRTVGDVTGHIDWGRRFDYMQQHTGQHLLSGVIVEQLRYDTASVHFGPANATIDVETASLVPEQIKALEERANALVAENRPITVSFENAATVTGLRKTPPREGELRIVTIGGIDRSACGGTHVHATGEIGPILLRKLERIRGTTRIEFFCGLRAIRQTRAEYGVLTELSAMTSSGIGELAGVFDKHRTELKDADSARRELEGKLNDYRARGLYTSATPDAGGRRQIVVREDNASLESLRGLAQACTMFHGAVFIGASAMAPGVVFAVSEDVTINAGATLKAALTGVGGRGGGTVRSAQGTVPTADAIEMMVRTLTANTRTD